MKKTFLKVSKIFLEIKNSLLSKKIRLTLKSNKRYRERVKKDFKALKERNFKIKNICPVMLSLKS